MEIYTKAIEKERAEEAANGTSDIITRNLDVWWEVGREEGGRCCRGRILDSPCRVVVFDVVVE